MRNREEVQAEIDWREKEIEMLSDFTGLDAEGVEWNKWRIGSLTFALEWCKWFLNE